MELSTLKCEDNDSHPVELFEQNASGFVEYIESGSSETNSAKDFGDELATISGFSLFTLVQATLHVDARK